MTGRKSDPPTLAIWWLLHAMPGRDNEALTGDLIERLREGKTRGWFWRQVFIAFFHAIGNELRSHWPHFCYAICAFSATWFFWDLPPLKYVPRWLHWSDLPWPWSQLALEQSRSALVILAALSILAAGLVIERSFRWVSLLRTAVLSLALIIPGHYSVDLFPWLLRPVPGDQNHKFLIIPFSVVLLLSFFTFLMAAWLGCPSTSRRTRESHHKPANL